MSILEFDLLKLDFFSTSEIPNLLTKAEIENKIDFFFEFFKEHTEPYLRSELFDYLISNPEYQKYIQKYFKDIQIKNKLFFYYRQNRLIEFLQVLPFLDNYTEDSYFDSVNILTSLIQKKDLELAHLFADNCIINPIFHIKLATTAISRGQKELAMKFIQNIKDWKSLNDFIDDTTIENLFKENDSDIIRIIEDKLDWNFLPFIISANKHYFTPETLAVIHKHKEEVFNKNKNFFTIPPESNQFIYFNLNKMNKGFSNKVKELVKGDSSKQFKTQIIHFLNTVFWTKTAFPEIDDQLFLKYLLPDNLRSVLNSVVRNIHLRFNNKKEAETLRFMNHYNHRRILDLIFLRNGDFNFYDIITGFNNFTKLQDIPGINLDRIFIKKPKSIKTIVNNLKESLEKCKQQNFKLVQDNIKELNNFEYNDVIFRLPKTSFELIDIGLELAICIGNETYAKKVYNRETNIILMYSKEEEKLIGVMEYKNGMIIQCKGKANANLNITLPNFIKKELRPLVPKI